jgi:hypothetical protein
MEVPMENVTPYAENFIPVIPTEYSYHTDENPFCWDSDCPCHSDNLLIAQVKEQFDNGLLSAEEVILTIQGKTL